MAKYRQANGLGSDRRRVGETIASDRAPAKDGAARRFNGQAQRTQRENIAPPPMRGGIRL